MMQNKPVKLKNLQRRKTDEDNLGFTYAELDRYIREGVIDDPDHKALIDRKHKMNLFKLKMMPGFDPGIEEKAGR